MSTEIKHHLFLRANKNCKKGHYQAIILEQWPSGQSARFPIQDFKFKKPEWLQG